MNCEEWLGNVLRTEGTVLCDCIRERAKAEGFSKAELKDARCKLRVKTFHQYDDLGATKNWYWYLDDTGGQK